MHRCRHILSEEGSQALDYSADYDTDLARSPGLGAIRPYAWATDIAKTRKQTADRTAAWTTINARARWPSVSIQTTHTDWVEFHSSYLRLIDTVESG